MDWRLEYDERVKVKGFSVLDEDFDFMLGDLCCEETKKLDTDRVRESLAKNRTRCLDAIAELYPL